MRLTALSLVISALVLTACRSEPVDLGLMCGDDAEATVREASAIVYGAEIPAPQVRDAHPLAEADLLGLDIGDAERLGLLASDAGGGLYHRRCSNELLCTADDARKTLASCADKAGCKIVGAVRLRTFHPLYLADTEGGHVCAPRWQ